MQEKIFKLTVEQDVLDLKSVQVKFFHYDVLLKHDSFEVIHGLSRMLRLTEEKMDTAIEIYKEELPELKDDGSFLINLVLKLMVHYIGLAKEDVGVILHDYKKILEGFKAKLNLRGVGRPVSIEDLLDEKRNVMKFCNDIYSFCCIYLDLFHIKLTRGEPIDQETVNAFPAHPLPPPVENV